VDADSAAHEVTQILDAVSRGERQASSDLLPLVYDELRKLAAARLAHEKPGQTLQATALVHEAYMRLVDAKKAPEWNGRGHFFAAAAEAMRRILVDHARRRKAAKRGMDPFRVEVDLLAVADDREAEKLVDLDEAITRLAQQDPLKADLVKLRFFAGLRISEAAKMLGISTATADRYWAYARAWLQREMGDQR
jgi:RNA polymerase sigma factor (TIGR02999 family)